ncbi:hypothetical protein OIU78_015257 [Salix suchowensis]|nr:hypothetical protein OIU78_015257 [Salix suchowensis]
MNELFNLRYLIRQPLTRTLLAGTEALFADVGHFTVRSIQISMCAVTYPALIAAYVGQAAFLRKHSGLVSETFFKSIPGIAVVFVMTLTSAFLVLIMLMIWKTNIFYVIVFVLTIGSVELLYLSSVLYKFDQGGYLPLAFAGVLMAIMYTWNNVYRRKYYYELDHKISPDKLKEVSADIKLSRLPGLAMFYSELVHGIPPIFKHYVENVPALHSVLVFVSIKTLPISKVPAEERFLFRRVDPKELNEFIRNECSFSQAFLTNGDVTEKELGEPDDGQVDEDTKKDRTADREKEQEEAEREIEIIDKACRAGVVHLIGENEVRASKGASLGDRIIINYAYNFLKKNLRQSEKVFDIPHKRMLKVGMTYEL